MGVGMGLRQNGGMAGQESLGNQFNKQYQDTIELVKSRAIWRIGEKLTEGEAFRCNCSNCRFESLHQRFDISRHRVLFGKSIREVEAPRPMLRCRRCGEQRHLRDVGELVVPSTIALANDVRAHSESIAKQTTPSSAPSSELLAAISLFNDEASGPVRLIVFEEIVQTIGSAHDELLRATGKALFLNTDQISGALSRSS
ncbi:MAG: hypothetical protein ACI9N0_001192 [Ilumatobacter sp.]